MRLFRVSEADLAVGIGEPKLPLAPSCPERRVRKALADRGFRLTRNPVENRTPGW